MRALWIVAKAVARLASGPDGEHALLGSPVASTRMRTAVAALEWKRAGNDSLYWNPEAPGTGQDVDWASVNACVVPKFHFDAPPEPWLDACRAARRSGRPLVLDVCEYPFKDDPAARSFYAGIRAFYSEALKICDALVVNSERMAEMMAPHSSRPPLVIDDAILGPARNIEFAPGGRLRLLWFGHGTNLRYLDTCVDALVRFAAQRPCRLTIVSEGSFGAGEVTRAMDARFAPALEARFVEWSLDAMAAALRRCDIVLIPSDPADPFKAGVSANRIAEVLRAGRFPVASPLPAYLPYSEGGWLGGDLTEGIRWALANPAEVRARIRRGQAAVGERLAPEKIGRQWRELLESLVSTRQ
jgi:glycosyltransferase involved in cell wall biosynthesis